MSGLAMFSLKYPSLLKFEQESHAKIEGNYFVALDASGYFSSHEIHCPSCCKKNLKDGTVTYYHQMLAAAMVHPNFKTVLPLALEPIIKQENASKNDCEHTAAKCLLVNLKKRHPHLKITVVLDGLYADITIVRLLFNVVLQMLMLKKYI
jgi:hypothetical protein